MNLDDSDSDDSDSEDIIENIEMEEELRETELENHTTYIGMPIYENHGIII